MDEYIFVWMNGGWWLKIDKVNKLFDYYDKTDAKWSDAFSNLISSKEFTRHGLYHADNLAFAIGFYGSNRNMNPIQATMDFRQTVFMNQLNALLEYGEIYINEKGGYNFKTSEKKPYDKFVRRTDFVFPDFKKSDIRVKRFQGGTHFYAYVGDMEVKDGDTIKWFTYEEAYNKALELVTNVKEN